MMVLGEREVEVMPNLSCRGQLVKTCRISSQGLRHMEQVALGIIFRLDNRAAIGNFP